jgi:hypothetical protein
MASKKPGAVAELDGGRGPQVIAVDFEPANGGCLSFPFGQLGCALSRRVCRLPRLNCGAGSREVGLGEVPREPAKPLAQFPRRPFRASVRMADDPLGTRLRFCSHAIHREMAAGQSPGVSDSPDLSGYVLRPGHSVPRLPVKYRA